jgi:hypothetical protein
MRVSRFHVYRVLTIFALALGFTVGASAFAQGYNVEDTGLTKAAQAAKYNINLECIHDAGGCLPQLMGDVVNALLGVFGALFLVLMVYGGVQYMIAGGSPDKVKAATSTLRNAIIGMVIVVSSWAITSFVLDVLTAATAPGDTVQADTPKE